MSDSTARPGYAFIDDIAIADVAFRARGPTLESVFEQAARATTEAMLDDLATLDWRDRRRVQLEDDDLEMLLLDFLQELIYRKDAESLLLIPETIHIRKPSAWVLEAVLVGETLDPDRHPLNADVKAVTLHRFALRESAEGWTAEVVLDV